MIEVNLLKDRWEKYLKRVIALKFLLFYFIFLFFILIIFGILFLSNRMILANIQNDIEKIQKEIGSGKYLYENLKNLDEECSLLCKKFLFYEDEYKNRITWSDKLQIISESIPDGMWVSKLYSKKEYTSNGKNFSIVIEGFISPEIISPEKGIFIFLRNLKEKGYGFFDSIKLSEIKRGKIEENDVYYFKLESALKE